MSKPLEVEQAWLEGLIRRSQQLNRNKEVFDSNDKKQLIFLADLAHLQGYIESAKYLLPHESE